MKKKAIFLSILALITSYCSGQTGKNKNNMIENKAENVTITNSEGYVVRAIDGCVEYRKDNILYIFRDGALTTIEELNWGGSDIFPLGYAHVFSNTPKEIVYTEISGDKSQTETYFRITLEKTVFNQKNSSDAGRVTKQYDAHTPLDIWLKLSETFKWNNFSVLESGRPQTEQDSLEITITVTTESGTSSVTNSDDVTWRKFFNIISDYLQSFIEKAEETVEPW
jgi:hypothetical protein